VVTECRCVLRGYTNPKELRQWYGSNTAVLQRWSTGSTEGVLFAKNSIASVKDNGYHAILDLLNKQLMEIHRQF
jgi:hypothetical protein